MGEFCLGKSATNGPEPLRDRGFGFRRRPRILSEVVHADPAAGTDTRKKEMKPIFELFKPVVVDQEQKIGHGTDVVRHAEVHPRQPCIWPAERGQSSLAGLALPRPVCFWVVSCFEPSCLVESRSSCVSAEWEAA